MSRRYPQYPHYPGESAPLMNSAEQNPGQFSEGPTHVGGYPGPPGGTGVSQGKQGYAESYGGPPGGAFGALSGQSMHDHRGAPTVDHMAGQVHQMNLGAAAPPQERSQSNQPIPTATPLSSLYPQSTPNVTQYPHTSPHGSMGGGSGTPMGSVQPIGAVRPPPASNIGPPPKPGEVYQPPSNPPPPPSSGMQSRTPPLSGGWSQPPFSGGQSQPPLSGGQSQPPFSGGQSQPPFSGGQSQPSSFSGGQSQPPLSGGQSQPSSFSGIQSQPPLSGGESHSSLSQPLLSGGQSQPLIGQYQHPGYSQPIQTHLPTSGVQSQPPMYGGIQNASQVGPPTLTSAVAPSTGVPTSVLQTAPPTGHVTAFPPTQIRPQMFTGTLTGSAPTGPTSSSGPPPIGTAGAPPPPTGLTGIRPSGHPLSGLSNPPGSGLPMGRPPAMGSGGMGQPQPGPPPAMGSGGLGQPGRPPAMGSGGLGQPGPPPAMGSGGLGQPGRPPAMGSGGLGQPQPGLSSHTGLTGPPPAMGSGGVRQPQPGLSSHTGLTGPPPAMGSGGVRQPQPGLSSHTGLTGPPPSMGTGGLRQPQPGLSSHTGLTGPPPSMGSGGVRQPQPGLSSHTGSTGPPPLGPQPGLVAGPVTLSGVHSKPGLIPGPMALGAAQPQPGGMMITPTSGDADGFNTTDPFLQPVNLLEQRNILPATPIDPPPVVLPNGLAKFAPDHRVFCCTMNTIPATSSLLSKLKLPLAIHLHPYKDMSTKDCPVVHPSIIIRCRSCRAYINPYVTFIDSRHWRCNLCFRANTLPEDFDFNPHSGHHGDRSHRLELKRSCMEYIAPSEYMVRPPQPCVYYFVVDVSFTSIDSGVLAVFCRSLLDHLDRLPGDARTLVGLLTFDSSLHFYSFPSTDSQPQMLVVSDIDDIFLPCPESLLFNLRDYKEIFRSLLEDLPRMFATNQSGKSAMGSAIHAATKLLHPIGGRVTVIQCALPNIGPGALKYRDVAPGSTKMATLRMAPASDFYKSLALDCNTQQIAIDIFAFSGQFMDLSTMSCAAKFSSGQVYYYHDFHHSRQAARERFQKDLRRYLTRKIGFEAVMRIRCTEGMSLHTFHGNFFVRSTDLLSLPCVNPDLGYTINISIDDNLKDYGSVCFQAALLYTSSRGERRIRVHTLCLPVSTQLAHIYARLNIFAITGTLANMGVDRATNATLGDAREALMNVVIDSGKVYRANLASSRQASQFALPASIKLLPLFVIALLKSTAFTLSSKVSYDRRTQAMNQIKCMPLDYYLCLLYPRLYAVHMLTQNDVIETDDGVEEICAPILQLSAEKINRYGVYLMDYGIGLYLWVCKDVSQEYISKILDVKHFGAIPETMCELPSLQNDCSKLLCKLVRQIRSRRQYILPFQVIREDGPHRLLFIEKLVDDRTEMGTSYYELLSHIARQQK